MPRPLRVLALVTLPTLGAGGRLRIEQYVPSLRSAGIELTISHFFDEATMSILYRPGHTLRKAIGTIQGIGRRVRDIFRLSRFDAVLIYREAIPVGPAVFERLLRFLNVPYVYDFDDALFVEAPGVVNTRWAWLRPTSRVAYTTKHAVAVIVGNEYLAEWARQFNPAINVLTTPVDTERHRPIPIGRRDDPVVIGWLGSHSTAPYLHFVDEPLKILAGRKRIVVRVIGGDYEVEGLPIDLVPYSLDTEAAMVATFDIGILPEHDDPWTRGKGAFKALVYMASGVPVVASPVGVNADVVQDEVTGLIAATDDEWVAALERLIDDGSLRARMGALGRQRVEERYSLGALAPRFARILRQALEPL